MEHCERNELKLRTPTPTSPPTPTWSESEFFFSPNEEKSLAEFSPAAQEESDDELICNDLESSGTGINPLNNPVILENLFRLCSTEHLAKFRQVSKFWYNVSLSIWRSRRCVRLDCCMISNSTLARYQSLHKKCQNPFWLSPSYFYHNPYITLLHRFFEFINNPKTEHERKPYRHYCLKLWEFKRNCEVIDSFWETCSSYITTLELQHPCFVDVESFRKVVYTSCPNLQRLTIKDCVIRSNNNHEAMEGLYYISPKYGEHFKLKHLFIDMDHEPLPVPWLEFLSHFPSLVSIKLDNAEVDTEPMAMLNAVKIIREHDNSKLPIKRLDILTATLYTQYSIPSEICDIIPCLDFPLESLIIDLGVERQVKAIRKVLQAHSATLKELSLYRGQKAHPYNNFPFQVQLDKLQCLSITDRLCKNMEFIKFMPNLQTLEIYDAVNDKNYRTETFIVRNTWESELDKFQLVNLRQLRIDYRLSEYDILNLTRWMPNVERLKMCLNDKQFSIVCGHWSKLTELEVLGIDLTDEGVTGRTKQYTDEDLEASEFKIIRPNITDLKCLRIFKHTNDDLENMSELSDDSAFHGFLKVDIHTLELCGGMSDEATAALLQAIPDCKLKRRLYNEDTGRLYVGDWGA